MFNNKGLADQSTNISNSFKTTDNSKHGRFSNQIIKAQFKQLEFLRHKCANLKDTMICLKNQNSQLKKQNNRLITLNSQYLDNINIFYDQKFQNDDKVAYFKKIFSEKQQLQISIKKYIKRIMDAFKKLEVDHGKLIKHCVVVQKQNKTLKDAFDQNRRMKQELLKVNHTDINVLVKEMEETEQENQRLRGDNNHKNYQIQKLILDLNKITVSYKQIQKQFLKEKKQMSENKALVNKYTQEMSEKQNHHQKALYLLQVKCDQLEKQLRFDQIEVNKMVEQNQTHRVQKVEFIQKQQSMLKEMKQMASVLYFQENPNLFKDKRFSSIEVTEFKKHPKRNRAKRSMSVFVR